MIQKIQFNRKDTDIDAQEFRVVGVETLSPEQWNYFSKHLLDDYDFLARYGNELYVDMYGTTNALLVMNKDTREGILVNTEGASHARYSAYLPFAGLYLDYELAKIADYCVTEGTGNTSDGLWTISFDEIYEHFQININDRNGFRDILLERIKDREEVDQIIATEDEYEISYHLEHCPQCQSGGIEAGFSLLSLLGCSLERVHFQCADSDQVIEMIDKIDHIMMTEEGLREWEDVLSAKVERIDYDGGLRIELSDCSPERLSAFAEVLYHRNNPDYSKWFYTADEPTVTEEQLSQYEPFDDHRLDVILAKHTLWIHDMPGGEQADFSGMHLEGVNFTGKKLLNAKFNNTYLNGCNFESAELCFADFSGSFIESCDFRYTTADEIVMRNCTLKNCDFDFILGSHGNFAHSIFYDSTVFDGAMHNSCFEGATFEKTNTIDFQTDIDTERTEEEWENASPGMELRFENR